MARTLLRLLAWTAATLIAMAVSWFGVHGVLSTSALDEAPRAVPVDPPSPATTTTNTTTTTVRAPATATSAASATTRATTSSTSTPTPTSAPSTASAASPDVRGYQLTGGRVVLELHDTSARLVSATPEPGWQVQTWEAEGWLRVDFSDGTTTSSCFVTWNGHPPTVQTS